ncbi:MAG: sensor histidine kinase [Anaerolineae bacterium]
MADQRLVSVQHNLRPVVANAETRLAEVKSRFFSAAAHELRTPLTTIIGYLEMLLDEEFGPLSESQREPLEMVSESVWHLRTVTNNLLAAARLEAGRVKLNVQPTDLALLVEAVTADFAPQLKARSQRFELQMPSDLPAALCDEKKVAQVIRNLLSYICERTPEGETIFVAVTFAAETGFLQIVVSSIDAALDAQGVVEMPEPSFVKEIGLAEADAANLELCVACSLVELHGGLVLSESAAEEGSSFYVTLPIADSPC